MAEQNCPTSCRRPAIPAARLASEDPTVAAIAGEAAAERYGLTKTR